jgi:GT2 family glycosyltransferase
MEDNRHHRIGNRYVGLFSVYAEDRPDYLFESLWTILRDQTRPLDHCIGVIEGELGTGLEQIVREFTEVEWIRIPKVANPLSFGLPTALNRGISACSTGDIILKIDTDDWYPSQRVEWTAEAFESHPDLALFGGQVSEWSQDGRSFIGYRQVPERHKEISSFGRKRNPFNGPTVAFRYEAAQHVGGFQEVGANEDYVLWTALLQAGFQAQNSPEVLAFMRGGASLVARRSTARTRRGEFEALQAIYRSGFFSFATFAAHVVGKQVVRRLPFKVNSYLYRNVLRTPAEHKSLLRAEQSLMALAEFRNALHEGRDVAAVVVSYNRFTLLTEVLRGLLSQYSVREIFVVDNASNEDVCAHLTLEFGAPKSHEHFAEFEHDTIPIRVQRMNKNLGGAGGFAQGMNWALQSSQAPFIWIMDDDAVPTQGSLNTLRSRALLMGTGVTVPRIVAHGATKMTYRNSGWSPHLVTNFRTPPKSGFIDVFSFVGPLFTRRALETVSPDCFASMFLHYDDYYFGLKLQLQGFKIFYDEEAVIDHRESSAIHQKKTNERSVRLRYFGLRNRLWLLLNVPEVKSNKGQRVWAFGATLAMAFRRAVVTPKYLKTGLLVILWAFADACSGRFNRKLI